MSIRALGLINKKVAILLPVALFASGIAPAVGATSPPQSFTITDATRNRDIPLTLYFPSPQFSCVKPASCPTAFISGGYGVSHLGYSFIANALTARGYLVVAVRHQLNTDAPMATSGDLYSLRMPVWRQGVENLHFASVSLSAHYPQFNWRKSLLVGHSNGGDISALFARDYPASVAKLITLDHRRMPLPRTDAVEILSIRATDFQADAGVLPNAQESSQYGISVVTIADSKHNDMYDGGSVALKEKIVFEINKFLSASEKSKPRISLPTSEESCFLLYELGVGEIRRAPSAGCCTRVSPASTFKIPHSLAALDAGVIASPDTRLAYDGTGQWPPSSRRDHTLASALHHSVVWYYQRVAEKLGPEREQVYLQKFTYGNMDTSSGLTNFWLGKSLQITPEEQLRFLRDLYENKLPVTKSASDAVKKMLVQPRGNIINAFGEYPFNAPWPNDLTVSAKTGSTTDQSGRGVRWLIGHIEKGNRAYIFVSCVIGTPAISNNAAIDLAANSIQQAGIW